MARRRSPADSAVSLLNRFPVSDMAKAVFKSGAQREEFLNDYVESEYHGRTYSPFRDAAAAIHEVSLGLDTSPARTFSEIEAGIIRQCKRTKRAVKQNTRNNVAVAKLLFDLVRHPNIRRPAYHYDGPDSLDVARQRRIPINLNFHLVDGDRPVFRFPQPRASMSIDEAILIMSVMHHAMVVGDFENAAVEIADLSRPDRNLPREPRIIRLREEDLMSRETLQDEAQAVYDLLLEIAKSHGRPSL